MFVKKLGAGKDQFVTAFLFFFVANIAFVPIILLQPLPTSTFLPYAMGSGLLYAIAFLLYVIALVGEEASLVGPLYNFNIFFLAILATIFLGEPFTMVKAAGLLLLTYGASFLNTTKGLLASYKAIFANKFCQAMMISSLLIALGRILDDLGQTTVSSITYAYVISCVGTLALLLVILVQRKIPLVIQLFKERPGTALLTGFSNGYSYLLLLLAITVIPVSVAEPASMVGMVVTVILAHFMFKESIKDRLLGVAIMLVGAWMVFL